MISFIREGEVPSDKTFGCDLLPGNRMRGVRFELTNPYENGP